MIFLKTFPLLVFLNFFLQKWYFSKVLYYLLDRKKFKILKNIKTVLRKIVEIS